MPVIPSLTRRFFGGCLFICSATLAFQPAWAAPPTPKAHTDLENQFRITSPVGWGPAPRIGRMVWHAASKNGTEMPDCGVIVSQDSSFASSGLDAFIEAQTQEQVKQLLSLNFSDIVIGTFERNFQLGGQRALHYIYSGTLNGERQTSMNIQTVRGDKLYTLGCNAPANQFPPLYLEFLRIADSFAFIGKKQTKPRQ